MMKVRISIDLSVGTLQRLNEQCVALGQSRNQFIENAVKEWLDRLAGAQVMASALVEAKPRKHR